MTSQKASAPLSWFGKRVPEGLRAFLGLDGDNDILKINDVQGHMWYPPCTAVSVDIEKFVEHLPLPVVGSEAREFPKDVFSDSDSRIMDLTDHLLHSEADFFLAVEYIAASLGKWNTGKEQVIAYKEKLMYGIEQIANGARRQLCIGDDEALNQSHYEAVIRRTDWNQGLSDWIATQKSIDEGIKNLGEGIDSFNLEVRPFLLLVMAGFIEKGERYKERNKSSEARITYRRRQWFHFQESLGEYNPHRILFSKQFPDSEGYVPENTPVRNFLYTTQKFRDPELASPLSTGGEYASKVQSPPDASSS